MPVTISVRTLLVVLTVVVSSDTWATTSASIWDCPPSQRASTQLSTPAIHAFQEGLVDLTINGNPHHQPIYLIRNDQGELFMAECDFKLLRLRPNAPALQINQVSVIPISRYDWLTAAFNAEQGKLALIIDPVWFEVTELSVSHSRIAEHYSGSSGAYMNYLVQGSDRQRDTRTEGVALDAVVFGDLGFFQSTHQVRQTTPFTTQQNQEHIRLNTQWTIDDPRHRRTLQIGDGASREGAAVPALRYAGLTLTSAFELDPQFSPFASVYVAGSAKTPSTIDLLLNDRRLGPSIPVPAGQFRIDQIPIVDGAGFVKVLIRDSFGNEQVLSLPYFKSAQLFAQGVHQYTTTLGVQRLDFDRYKAPFGLTTHRYGLTDAVTISASGSAGEYQRALGIGGAARLPWNWVGEVSGAHSHSQQGHGHRFELTASFQEFRLIGLGISHRRTSRHFRLLGDESGPESNPIDSQLVQLPERTLSTLTLSKSLGDWGALSVSHTQRTAWTAIPSRRLTTVSWSKSLAPGLSIGLSLFETKGVISGLLGFAVNLSPRDAVRVSLAGSAVAEQRDTLALSTEFQRSLPADEGFGFRAVASKSLLKDSTVNSGIFNQSFISSALRSSIGLHSIEIEDQSSALGWRLQSAGAIGWISNVPFVAPPISGAFALVSTKDGIGIPIYRENNRATQTNSRGLAILTPLRPFESNRISIRAEEVPLDYKIGPTARQVAPQTRGGIFLEFPLERQFAAVVQLRDDQEIDLPRGAKVVVQETKEEAFVGLRGETYLTNLPGTATLLITTESHQCRIQINRPRTGDPQPRIGPVQCPLIPRDEGVK